VYDSKSLVLSVTGASAPLIVKYDANNYLSINVASDGNSTFGTTGTDAEFTFNQRSTWSNGASSNNAVLTLNQANSNGTLIEAFKNSDKVFQVATDGGVIVARVQSDNTHAMKAAQLGASAQGPLFVGTNATGDVYTVNTSGFLSKYGGASATAGHILVADGSKYTPVAIGSSGQYLKVNSGATGLEYATFSDSGLPTSVGTPVSLTAQGATISTTTLYTTIASDGWYQVLFNASITRAASSSCTLGVQLRHTNASDNVVKTWPTNNTNGVNQTTTNNTTATLSGSLSFYCKASTNIQYNINYSSSGATSMQYSFFARVIKI
jgi:hypothetical protein